MTPKQGRPDDREADLDGQHTQGNGREHQAVEHHHDDIDHREGRIQQGGQGLAGEEAADLFKFGDAGAQFTHRPAIEVAKGQAQQVVDHLRTQAQVNAIGGFGKEEGAQRADDPLHQGDHHQGKAKHLQGVEAALVDHLVNDHLNQQGVGQAE